MTCEEFQERLDELALDSVDRSERAALEAHLREAGPHRGCAEALARARRAVHAVGQALDPVRPPPGLWAAIEASTTAEQADDAGLQQRLPWVAVLLAFAAMLVFAVLWRRGAEASAAVTAELASARNQLQEIESRQSEIEKGVEAAREDCGKKVEALRLSTALDAFAIALLQKPGVRVLAFAAQGKHTDLKAAALYDPQGGRAMVVSTSLPADAAHDYELWVIRGKEPPHRAGLLLAAAPGVYRAEIAASVIAQGPPDAFAISIEKKGGVDSPTDVALVVSAHS